MTQEEKELLLKDLSARLLYGVMCQVDDGAAGLNDGKLVEINITKELVRFDVDYHWDAYIDDVKPYLRPMSSMTKEEKLYLKLNYGFELHGDVLSNLHIIKGGGYYEREGEYVEPTEDRQYTHITIDTVSELIKWLNAHHFDYRGLIPKRLAIEAPKGMYNLK